MELSIYYNSISPCVGFFFIFLYPFSFINLERRSKKWKKAINLSTWEMYVLVELGTSLKSKAKFM